MRFQKGIHYPHPPRGPGRRRYRMSDAAYQARLRNLQAAIARAHTSRHDASSLKLRWQRIEPSRATAQRLGLRSHAYRWKVARKYRAGLIPMLPRSQQELLAMRDSLYAPDSTAPASVQILETQPKGIDGHGWNCECAGCRISRLIAEVVGRN